MGEEPEAWKNKSDYPDPADRGVAAGARTQLDWVQLGWADSSSSAQVSHALKSISVLNNPFETLCGAPAHASTALDTAGVVALPSGSPHPLLILSNPPSSPPLPPVPTPKHTGFSFPNYYGIKTSYYGMLIVLS